MTEQNLQNAFGDGTGYKGNKKTEEKKSDFGYNLKTGDNVLRVLPAIHSAVARNLWAVYYATHWLDTAQGGRFQVVCTNQYDRKEKKFLNTCAFCRSQESSKQLMFKAQRALEDAQLAFTSNRDKMDEGAQALAQDELETLKEAYFAANENYRRPQGKFYANIMLEDGKVTQTGLPKGIFEDLAGKKVEGEEGRQGGLLNTLLEKQGLDAISVNGGVWLNVRREGSGQFNTKYKVLPVTEIGTTERNGKQVKVEYLKECPLSDEQKLEVLKTGKDLNHLFDHVKFSEEEQQRVLDSDCDLTVILDLVKSKRPLTASDVPF